MTLVLFLALVVAARGGEPPRQHTVALQFPPTVAPSDTATLLCEGSAEAMTVPIAVRDALGVATLPPDQELNDVRWLLTGDGWLTLPARGEPEGPLTVVPAGRITGKVEASSDGGLPTSGCFTLQCSGKQSPAAVPERIPFVLADGTFSASLPAGTWDVSMELPGFSGAVLGTLTVVARAMVGVPGPIRLKPAATLQLQLSPMASPSLPGTCSAWLFEAAELDAAQCALASGGTSLWTGARTADRLGAVQFSIASGTETFAVVECPPWPPLLAGPLPLTVGSHRRAEVRLGPASAVEVAAPFLAEFLVHPQNRAIVAAVPVATRERSWCAWEAEFSRDGEAVLPILPWGEWEFQLLAGSRQTLGRGAPVAREIIALEPAQHQRLMLAQPPMARGRVAYAGEPATCLLTFERPEQPGWERHTWSDNAGHFIVLGVEPAAAQVTARCTRPSVEAFLPEVHLAAGRELDLELPAASLVATVVNAKGLPQRGREVVLRLLDGPGVANVRWGVQGVRRTSDEAGRARFSGLPAGRYRVEVFAEQQRRGAAEVTLAEDEAGKVTVTERGATVRFRVRDAAGRPVPGATLWVTAFPLAAAAALPEGAVVDTDRAGEADVALWESLSGPLNVVADVPSAGRFVFLVPADASLEQKAAELSLPLAGGEVEVVTPPGSLAIAPMVFAVRSDGAFTSFGLARGLPWVREDGAGRWVLGPLDPGSYRFLALPWTPPAPGPQGLELLVRDAWTAARERGVPVEVLPGQRTFLRLP